MLTKEQEELLNTIARRDGCYMTVQTERGVRYTTGDGREICRDETDEPTEMELLKARIEQQEQRLAVLEGRR